MIRITAPRGPQPFSDVILERARERLRAYYNTEDLERRQRRGVIDNEWKAIRRPVQDALLEYFNGKCAYCESLVNVSPQSAIQADLTSSGTFFQRRNNR